MMGFPSAPSLAITSGNSPDVIFCLVGAVVRTSCGQILHQCRQRHCQVRDSKDGPGQRMIPRIQTAFGRRGNADGKSCNHCPEPEHHQGHAPIVVLVSILDGEDSGDCGNTNAERRHYRDGEPVGPRHSVVPRVDDGDDAGDASEHHCQDESSPDFTHMLVHGFLPCSGTTRHFA